ADVDDRLAVEVPAQRAGREFLGWHRGRDVADRDGDRPGPGAELLAADGAGRLLSGHRNLLVCAGDSFPAGHDTMTGFLKQPEAPVPLHIVPDRGINPRRNRQLPRGCATTPAVPERAASWP